MSRYPPRPTAVAGACAVGEEDGPLSLVRPFEKDGGLRHARPFEEDGGLILVQSSSRTAPS